MRKRTHTKWMRAVPLLLVAIAFGAGAYAFTASNTFSGNQGGSAGAGSAVISGYDIGTPTYVTDVGDDSKIASFSFYAKHVSATSVIKAKLLDAGNWAPCTVGALGGAGLDEATVTCTFAAPGDEPTIELADNLTVAGVN